MTMLGDLVSAVKGLRSSPKEVPSIGFASQQGAGEFGRVGKANVRLYRNWAEHSEWVRAAINVRKSQVSSAEWDIVPFDVNRSYSVRLQRKVKQLFDMPNPRADSFRTFIEPVVEDLLVLDAGSIEKVRSPFASAGGALAGRRRDDTGQRLLGRRPQGAALLLVPRRPGAGLISEPGPVLHHGQPGDLPGGRALPAGDPASSRSMPS